MLARPVAVVRPWRWWTGFVLTVAAAIWMTVLAYREGLPPALNRIWQIDKIMHFLVAGLLAFFLDGALGRRVLFVIGGVAVPLAAVGVLLPSGIEEALQVFSVIRTANIWDYASDVAGVLVFIPLSRRIAK
jgi:hypothetical protein